MDILYNDLYTFTIVHMENLSTNSELFWWRTISLISWPLQVIISFSMQKKMVNSVQKKVKNQTFWLANDQRNSQIANQTRALNVATFKHAENLQAKQWPEL